ncbi:hypothetical protein NQ317_009685 [Molorchus minor]|uniref:Uncharacterized protein n=1 Tax=Molorchus minor TaxID=1323400 RepID=A0ABQ9JIB4_9CUCU|nr:hypothetical protein NQ317_009685 [Molorchus minor]
MPLGHVLCYLCVFLWTCDARNIEVRADGDDEKTVFELDEFLNGTFSSRTWNGTWISGMVIIPLGIIIWKCPFRRSKSYLAPQF